jgi:transcriptional regulator with XRE-family HTH domain
LEFKDRLLELRIGADLLQKELADKIGVNQALISYFEKGLKTPSVAVSTSLADCFGVSLDYLMGRSDEKGQF